MLLEKSVRKVKFFLNRLDPNMTNIIKDILIILIEDIKKITPGREKVLTLQKPVRIWKKKKKKN